MIFLLLRLELFPVVPTGKTRREESGLDTWWWWCVSTKRVWFNSRCSSLQDTIVQLNNDQILTAVNWCVELKSSSLKCVSFICCGSDVLGWVFQYVCVMCILLSDSPAPYHSKSNYSLIETFLKSPQSLVDKIKTRNFTVTCILHSCVNKLQHHENTKTLHKQNCEKTNVIFQKYHIGGSKCIESQC